MRIALWFLTVLVLGVLLCGGDTQAAVQQNDDVTVSYYRNENRPGGFNGGPFRAQIWDDPNNAATVYSPRVTPALQDLVTFCVQTNNFFNPGSTYNISSVTALTTAGGSPNYILTGYAAWVYEQFRNNENHSPTSTDLGTTAEWARWRLYQQAIWAGMVTDDGSGITTAKIGTSSGSEFEIVGTAAWTPYEDLGISIDQFYYHSSWVGASELLKLQNRETYTLMTLAGDQDQMFLADDSGDHGAIPEPGSLAIWGLLSLSAGAAAAMRRRKQASRTRWSDENRAAILSIVEGGR